MDGDNQGISRGFIGNAPRLPPKFPVNRGSLLSDLDAATYGNKFNTSWMGNPIQHRRTPSHSTEFQEQPFWLNDLLDDAEGPSRKVSHRRSASDSFTYLGNSGSLHRFSNIAEEDESECNAVIPSGNIGNEDGSQLNDLLDEIQQLQNQQNLPISTGVEPVGPKHDISIANKAVASKASLGDPQDQLPKSDGISYANVAGGSVTRVDGNVDPKQGKRALTNRQSAQRSRVRKLQYIAELERIVNVLQMDVSSLSTQVLYLKHQQAVLELDNNALKQRISFCLQEKSIKDSQNEILIKDVKRMQKLIEFQVLHQQQKQKQQLQRRNIHRHSSLPSDFGVQMQQYTGSSTASLQGQPIYSSTDSLADLLKDMSGISLNSGSSNATSKEE